MRNHDDELITRETKWRTQIGRYVRICDMDDHHLLCAIRCLRGLSPRGTTITTTDVRRRKWLNAMANEAYARGLTLDPPRDTDPLTE